MFQITAPLLSCKPIYRQLKFTSQGNSMECPFSEMVKCFQDSVCTIVELVCVCVCVCVCPSNNFLDIENPYCVPPYLIRNGIH
jgi:hypothetical protein